MRRQPRALWKSFNYILAERMKKVKQKTVKVTTDNKISIIDVDFGDFRDIQRAIGGNFETVHTRLMADYFKNLSVIMLVDEEGILKGLPLNALGCAFYGTQRRGNPIVGDVIFASAVGEDIVGPADPEAMAERLLGTFLGLERE